VVGLKKTVFLGVTLFSGQITHLERGGSRILRNVGTDPPKRTNVLSKTTT